MDVSSGMGSSSPCSSIGARRQRKSATPRCKCGRPSVVYTSKTERNSNRAFFGCPNFKEKKPYYNFFMWVDDATNDTMELEDWGINKLELNVAEIEFKLNYVDMKLNDEQQLKVNEHRIKINDLSMKMLEEFDRVDKEIKHVGRCARVFAGTIIVVFIICIYYFGSRLE